MKREQTGRRLRQLHLRGRIRMFMPPIIYTEQSNKLLANKNGSHENRLYIGRKHRRIEWQRRAFQQQYLIPSEKRNQLLTADVRDKRLREPQLFAPPLLLRGCKAHRRYRCNDFLIIVFLHTKQNDMYTL